MRRRPGAGAHHGVGDRLLEAADRARLELRYVRPRLSFHFATTMDLFEEVAKLRAARRMWYRIATERFGAQDPRRAACGSSPGTRHDAHGAAAAEQHDPLDDPVPGAVLGGAQSIHVMGYDEALPDPVAKKP